MQLKARGDLNINLCGEADLKTDLNGAMNLKTTLSSTISPEYVVVDIRLPLKNNLISDDGKYTMTFTRNSQAYNVDYVLINSNTPRYWPLGTTRV